MMLRYVVECASNKEPPWWGGIRARRVELPDGKMAYTFDFGTAGDVLDYIHGSAGPTFDGVIVTNQYRDRTVNGGLIAGHLRVYDDFIE